MSATKTFLGLVALIIIGVLIFVFVRMQPAAAPAQGSLVASAVYECNAGKSISASFYQGESKPAVGDQPPVPGGSVHVALSDGRAMDLAQTISADGVRYANVDESFVFWSKGNGALVLENNEQKSYIGCISVAKDPGGLPQTYQNGGAGFSIRLPSLQASTTNNGDSYKLDESYQYQALGPGKGISGIKFSIPPNKASGTNLSMDSYISVEEIPQVQTCTATLFLDKGAVARSVTEGDTTYSVASSSGAAVGNRYDETVYALPGTNPCIAVRYFIHYGAFGNYPAGTVKEFDERALTNEFDAIRRTLTVI